MTRSFSSATIERIVSGGWGLTHVGSLATFVRGTLPGEQVTLMPGEVQQGYQIATLESVDTSSPDRIVPACSKFGVCGGCQFQHVRYAAQLRQKTDIVHETFSRIGEVKALTLMPTVPSPFPYEYRRWVRFSVFPQDQGFHLGFRQEHSHQSIAGTECLLIPEAIRSVVDQVENRLSQARKLPMPLSHVEIRSSGSFGNHLLIFRGRGVRKEQARELLELFQDIPTVHGLVVTSSMAGGRSSGQPVRLVQGEEYLFERFADMVFRISDRSFMQANWPVYEII